MINRRSFFAWSVSIWMFLFSGLYADTSIVIFPGQMSYVRQTLSNQYAVNGQTIVRGLPKGVLVSTVFVHSPTVSSWRWVGVSDLDNISAYIGHSAIVGKQKGTIIGGSESGVWIQDDAGIRIVDKKEIQILSDQSVLSDQLVLQLASSKSATISPELSYFNSLLFGKVSYVGRWDSSKDGFYVSAQLLIQNNTMTRFPDASLVLISGLPNLPSLASDSPPQLMRAMSKMALSESDSDPGSDVVRWPIPGTVSILPGQTAVALLSDLRLNTRRYYVFHARPYGQVATPVDIELIVTNSSQQALAAGDIQLFADNQFVGYASFPALETTQDTQLSIGKAFGITGEKQDLRHERTPDRQELISYRLVIKNAKSEPVTVRVEDQLPYGVSDVVKASENYQRLENNVLIFEIKVPANQNKVITYTISRHP